MDDYMWYCPAGLDFYAGLESARLGHPDRGGETIDIVAKHCFARRTPFKVLTHPRTHLLMNSKYAPRGSSGKLIAIYPGTSEALRSTLDELDIALVGGEDRTS
jgi:hypothetical protein